MYKITVGSTIVDVVDELIFVRYDSRCKMMMRCDKQEAQGILSEDSSIIWHLAGYPPFGIDGYQTATATIGSPKEGAYLKEQLEAGKEPEIPPENPDGSGETVMSMVEMQTAIIQLQTNAADSASKEDVQAIWNQLDNAYAEGVAKA